MTGRIDTTFANAKKAGRGTLGVFITAGDPDAATTSAFFMYHFVSLATACKE